MPHYRLDQKLLGKVAAKLKKPTQAINVKVSKKASKLGISSEAALVLIAKEHDIGTAAYQRKLDSAKQAEIRDGLPSIFRSAERPTRNPGKTVINKKSLSTPRTSVKTIIEYLLADEDLRSRCTDILLAKSNFDRPINQATLVLEDRIRNKALPAAKLVGENLVNYAFHPELSQTVLKISDNADEQRGFTFILRNVVPAFRNPTHHHIMTKFTRLDALKVCAFIDVLLGIVESSKKIR